MPIAHTYRLKFADGQPPSPDVEFEAPDAFRALAMAHDRARQRPAELWRDGEQLCTLRRINGEVWEIRPVERVFG